MVVLFQISLLVRFLHTQFAQTLPPVAVYLSPAVNGPTYGLDQTRIVKSTMP